MSWSWRGTFILNAIGPCTQGCHQGRDGLGISESADSLDQEEVAFSPEGFVQLAGAARIARERGSQRAPVAAVLPLQGRDQRRPQLRPHLFGRQGTGGFTQGFLGRAAITSDDGTSQGLLVHLGQRIGGKGGDHQRQRQPRA